MIIILSGGGSWLRRLTVRCSACHRLYRTVASVIATCSRCGEPGPWILDCRGQSARQEMSNDGREWALRVIEGDSHQWSEKTGSRPYAGQRSTRQN